MERHANVPDERAAAPSSEGELTGFTACTLHRLEDEVHEAVWHNRGRVLRRQGDIEAVVLECRHWIVTAVRRDPWAS